MLRQGGGELLRASAPLCQCQTCLLQAVGAVLRVHLVRQLHGGSVPLWGLWGSCSLLSSSCVALHLIRFCVRLVVLIILSVGWHAEGMLPIHGCVLHGLGVCCDGLWGSQEWVCIYVFMCMCMCMCMCLILYVCVCVCVCLRVCFCMCRCMHCRPHMARIGLNRT